MSKGRFSKENEDDFKDLVEFGVSRESFLNIRETNQRTNLKKLKTILKETSILVQSNVRTLSDVIYTLEKCLAINKVTDDHRETIGKGIDVFKGSLFDLIWNIDNILKIIEYGHLFKNEKNVAEMKVIQIVEIINEANNCFDGIKIEGANLAYDQIEIVVESLMQISRLLNIINGIYDDL